MNTLLNISLGFLHGFWDSIKGMTFLFYIDEEIIKQNAAKQQELERFQHRYRRSPSPTPSSISNMEENIPEQQGMPENPDERRLDSIKKPQARQSPKEPKTEKKIAKQVLKCCMLNGGFTLISIITFEQLLLPGVRCLVFLCCKYESETCQTVWLYLSSTLKLTFSMGWVMPIFLLSKLVSSLWFADIANAAYRVRKGNPQLIPNISKLIADFLFSLLVQALFLAQTMLMNLLPIRWVAVPVCFLHLALLYSLYCFEYKWFNMGWELHRRLNYIERNWPYFLGFGLPLTLVTNATDSTIISSCIFSIFFPLFILSGNEARPVVGITATPMRLFSPVIFVSNLFFGRPKNAPPPTRSAAADRLTPTSQFRYTQQQQALMRQRSREQQLRAQHRANHQLHRSETRSRYSDSSSSRQATPERFNAEREPIFGHMPDGRGMRPPLVPTPVVHASGAARQRR